MATLNSQNKPNCFNGANLIHTQCDSQCQKKVFSVIVSDGYVITCVDSGQNPSGLIQNETRQMLGRRRCTHVRALSRDLPLKTGSGVVREWHFFLIQVLMIWILTMGNPFPQSNRYSYC